MHLSTLLALMTLIVLAAAGVVVAGDRAGLYVLQSNDLDPTSPTSQPGGRWYHWIGVEPVVTHLESAMAVDAGRFARRGQRIEVRMSGSPVAVEVKIKRIGNPGPLRCEAGSDWGKSAKGTEAIRRAATPNANFGDVSPNGALRAPHPDAAPTKNAELQTPTGR